MLSGMGGGRHPGQALSWSAATNSVRWAPEARSHSNSACFETSGSLYGIQSRLCHHWADLQIVQELALPFSKGQSLAGHRLRVRSFKGLNQGEWGDGDQFAFFALWRIGRQHPSEAACIGPERKCRSADSVAWACHALAWGGGGGQNFCWLQNRETAWQIQACGQSPVSRCFGGGRCERSIVHQTVLAGTALWPQTGRCRLGTFQCFFWTVLSFWTRFAVPLVSLAYATVCRHLRWGCQGAVAWGGSTFQFKQQKTCCCPGHLAREVAEAKVVVSNLCRHGFWIHQRHSCSLFGFRGALPPPLCFWGAQGLTWGLHPGALTEKKRAGKPAMLECSSDHQKSFRVTFLGFWCCWGAAPGFARQGPKQENLQYISTVSHGGREVGN